MSEKAYSIEYYDRDTYVHIKYDAELNAVYFKIRTFNYNAGFFNENAYLRWCDFSYTTGNGTYNHVFRIETHDQSFNGFDWTWMMLRYKKRGAQIRLDSCYLPEDGTMWPDTDDDIRYEVKNEGSNAAYVTLIWYLNTEYNDVSSIRLDGLWLGNGTAPNHVINHDDHDLVRPQIKSSASALKSEVKKSNTSEVKVSANEDAIVVTGAEVGENIKVYTVSGTEVKSVVANSDAVNIKLAKNQVYIVTVGKAHYKVSL